MVCPQDCHDVSCGAPALSRAWNSLPLLPTTFEGDDPLAAPALPSSCNGGNWSVLSRVTARSLDGLHCRSCSPAPLLVCGLMGRTVSKHFQDVDKPRLHKPRLPHIGDHTIDCAFVEAVLHCSQTCKLISLLVSIPNLPTESSFVSLRPRQVCLNPACARPPTQPNCLRPHP